ncbi:MAG: S-layer homology domain-containing protein, partial [Desulfotomaculum sp.]|nr:S-layer homology domain-containing protein [Desulfotomaculum sp.]
TRQEMAAMISRALAYKGVKTTVTADEASTALQQFHDRNQVAAWAKEAVVIGVKNELIIGRSANEYAPLANATRAESVVILKRLLEK